MFKRLPVILLILLGVFSPVYAVKAQDDIPDNCEFQYGAYYRPSVFPRYELQNRRLLLVDWTTGAEVGVLAADIDDTLIRAWSPDCRYLAVATGSSDSRATVVYDTLELRAVGSVLDARFAPHSITWGPNNFLMVEGRNGAVLWNVPINQQYALDVGFNTTTYRNFDRLRWDAPNQQVIANLANGGRAVYDLNTGGATILASSNPGELVLGGERFACTPDSGERGGGSLGLGLYYARSGGVVYLGRGSRESFLSLEADVPPIAFRRGGWSINCRYVAAALDSAEDDRYDTVIWDVLEGRRAGTYTDAREVPHRLTWDTAETHVLIETRDGAYLWNIRTNARVLVNDQVEQPATCYYTGCQPISFYHVYWDAGRNQMLGVPVQTPNAVVAYDVNTGVEVGRYTVEGADAPIDFITSNDSRLLLTTAGSRAILWDRVSGAVTSFDIGFMPNTYYALRTSASISTDNRLFAISNASNLLHVWDLTTLTTNSAPVYVYNNIYYLFPVYFINGDTIETSSSAVRRLNVVTGEIVGNPPGEFDPESQMAQTFSPVSGSSGRGARAWASQPHCSIAVRYDRDLRQLIVRDVVSDAERVIEADLNTVGLLLLSPDCRTIYADVYEVNTSLPYEEVDVGATIENDSPKELIFWDVESGERLTVLDNPRMSKYGRNGVWWNPDGTRGFISAGRTYFLINAADRRTVPVIFQDTDRGYLPGDTDTYWDTERGLIFVAGYGEVFALDMQTGVERLRFPARENGRGGCSFAPEQGCGMTFSDDGAWVFIYGNETLSAWNIDTLAYATVPVESAGGNAGGTLISPDGRFLVVSRSAVRVWNLTALPANVEDRAPIATYGVGNNAVISVRFVDNTTLEVVTRTADGTATTRYDVATGTRLGGG